MAPNKISRTLQECISPGLRAPYLHPPCDLASHSGPHLSHQHVWLCGRAEAQSGKGRAEKVGARFCRVDFTVETRANVILSSLSLACEIKDKKTQFCNMPHKTDGSESATVLWKRYQRNKIKQYRSKNHLLGTNTNFSITVTSCVPLDKQINLSGSQLTCRLQLHSMQN